MYKKLLFLAVLAVLTACHNNSDPIILASKPNWTGLEDNNYSTSMTLTCVPPEGEHWAKDDELAAFLNDRCIATATAIDSIFYLGIPGEETECNITISYYSATLKSIRSFTLSYYPNDRLGTTDEPYIMNFSGSGAPSRVTLTGTILQPEDESAPKRITINDGLNTTTKSNGDVIMQLVWREGDKVRLQGTNISSEEQLNLINGAGTATGTVSAYASSLPDQGTFYVTYPYESTTASSGIVNFTISNSQTYVANNIDNGILPMSGSVIYDETNHKYSFTLSPVAAVLALRLQSSTSTSKPVVSSIEIINSSSSQDNLSGSFTMGSSISGGSGKTITLDCSKEENGGVELDSESSTLFHFVLPAVTLLKGTQFTITYKINNIEYTKTQQINKTDGVALGAGRYTRLPVIYIGL